MPAVFVHGVPDTSEVWDPILKLLGRDDAVALRLPGFGEPVPSGFDCTMDEYVDLIVEKIAEHGEPVDLVGHDWGSMFTQRIASTRPELVRTWTMSNGGVTDQFAWHDLAQQWQTPEVGEQVMELMTPEIVALTMTDAGHPDPSGMAARIDTTMTDAVLRLYRSAVDIKTLWPPSDTQRSRPGLLIWGRDDPFAAPAAGRRLADITGGTFLEVEGQHWGVFENPDETARELRAHWDRAT